MLRAGIIFKEVIEYRKLVRGCTTEVITWLYTGSYSVIANRK
jgi:hypothetical protein